MSNPTQVGDDPIVERLFEALRALTRNETRPWAEMFTPDGIMEFPYAPAGYPERLVGREAIAAYMRDYPAHISLRDIIPDRVFRAGDTRIVEFSAEGTAVATGRPFTMRYVAILTVRGDRVEVYRDYWNPLTALTAVGGLDGLNALGATK